MKNATHNMLLSLALALTVLMMISTSGEIYAQSVSGTEIQSAINSYVRRAISPSTEYFIEFKDLRSKYDVGFSNPFLSVSVANSLFLKGLVTFMVKAESRVNASTHFSMIPVTARVRTFEKVLIATRMIHPHEVIDSSSVSLMRSETTEIVNPVASIGQLDGKWTNRWIQAGKILTSDMFDLIPLIKRGDDVAIIFRTKNVTVKDRGTALQDGKLNEVIKVANEYNEPLLGKVIAKGEVLLVN
ncbi:MAG: flagellar basal body P-ring formation chaperone FlgA [Candidatus Kryptoniota bacterium]